MRADVGSRASVGPPLLHMPVFTLVLCVGLCLLLNKSVRFLASGLLGLGRPSGLASEASETRIALLPAW